MSTDLHNQSSSIRRQTKPRPRVIGVSRISEGEFVLAFAGKVDADRYMARVERQHRVHRAVAV